MVTNDAAIKRASPRLTLIVVFAPGLGSRCAPLGLGLGQGRLSEPFNFSSSFDTPSLEVSVAAKLLIA